MTDEKLIDLITREVLRQLGRLPAENGEKRADSDYDITSEEARSEILLENPVDSQELAHMKKRTTARIGVGKCGARLNTRTMLTLRADHAQARDSVLKDVDSDLISRLGLFTVKSRCDSKDVFITRPDLGRRLSPESVEVIKVKCRKNPDVQIFASDGLSSSAIDSNLEKILPVLNKGLESKGYSVGTPFFLKYGRVAAEDEVAEIVGARVVCVLIGERPGLATAESMSAYIVYNAHVGTEESKRTVVSNIHKDGLSAVEAGAYIVDVIEKIIKAGASGVDLVK